MSDEFYAPGQLRTVAAMLPEWYTPRWFLLAGPADANEAQTARELWPDVKIVGVEPNAEAIEWQKAHGWPSDAPLIHAAVGDVPGKLRMVNQTGSLRHLRAHQFDSDNSLSVVEIPVVTWDVIDLCLGPFDEALLWMDIEGWELKALQGAEGLLKRKAVRVISIEMQDQFPGRNRSISVMMGSYGFRSAGDWGGEEGKSLIWNRVYVREGT